jgi:hypothetical protein
MPDEREVFISYAHEDAEWKDRLVTFLRVIEKHGAIHTWDDGRLRPGDSWRTDITAAMKRATIAVLLLSPDFLASRFIRDEELPLLLKRRDKEGIVVLPVVVRPCSWTLVEDLAGIQVFPGEGQVLSSLKEHQIEQSLNELNIMIHRHLVPEEEDAAVDAPTPTPTGTKEKERDERGFLTVHGVKEAIRRKRGDDVIGEPVRILATTKQRTWMAATAGYLYCLLDDANTQSHGRVIQWRQPLGVARPVRVRQPKSRKYTGLVDIGRKQNWLYSIRAWPQPEELKKALEDMLANAGQ